MQEARNAEAINIRGVWAKSRNKESWEWLWCVSGLFVAQQLTIEAARRGAEERVSAIYKW